jgi:hypothetical protein
MPTHKVGHSDVWCSVPQGEEAAARNPRGAKPEIPDRANPVGRRAGACEWACFGALGPAGLAEAGVWVGTVGLVEDDLVARRVKEVTGGPVRAGVGSQTPVPVQDDDADGVHASAPELCQAVDREPSIPVEQVDIFEFVPGSDVARIDVEGGEWAILSDPRFARFSPTFPLFSEARGKQPRRSQREADALQALRSATGRSRVADCASSSSSCCSSEGAGGEV